MKPLKYLQLLLGIGALCSAIWLAGCSGKTNTDHFIDVTVLDDSTMTPVPQAQLALLQLNNKSSLNSSTIVLGGETDANGTFQFELRPFKNKDASEIRIDASIGTQNQVGGLFYVDLLQVGSGFVPYEDIIMDAPFALDILAESYAFVEILPMNGSPADITRRVIISLDGDGYFHQVQLTDNDLKNDFLYPVKADDKVALQWTVETALTTREEFTDTIMVAARDTLSYIITL